MRLGVGVSLLSIEHRSLSAMASGEYPTGTGEEW